MEMNIERISIVMAVVALFLASLFSTPSLAEVTPSRDNLALPSVQLQGQTEYITGGIGKDESEAILREGSTWPLTLELVQTATPRPQYISDVRIVIKDKSGNSILDIDADGPYVLVKLPAGRYSLDAVYESKKLHRNLDIRKGHHEKVTLVWPAAE